MLTKKKQIIFSKLEFFPKSNFSWGWFACRLIEIPLYRCTEFSKSSVLQFLVCQLHRITQVGTPCRNFFCHYFLSSVSLSVWQFSSFGKSFKQTLDLGVKIVITLNQYTTSYMCPVRCFQTFFSCFEEFGGSLCCSALTTENSHLLDKF